MEPTTTSPPTSTTASAASALTSVDSIEHWEQIRRSVAMLPTGAWALRREQALEVLSKLLLNLRTKQP